MASKLEVNIDIPEWLEMMRRKQEPVREAATAALKETAANAVQEGRSDIAAAGKFSGGWISGLQYRMEGEDALEPKAIVFHKIGLAQVFERGITIHGKPLMWIPTMPGAPRPRASGRRLTRATVRGQPMLFDAADRDRHRKPLYIGVPSVRIAKKWHIVEIVKKHMEQFKTLFMSKFRAE
jgi:hypothetical protein